MAKTYRQPKPPKRGRAKFITEVQKCDTDASRTTIMPLVKRAIADFNFPPSLITPHVPATSGSVRNWLSGKSTPNVYSRNDLKIVLLKFLRGQDLGPPEEDFRALRLAFKKPDAYLRENFDPLLNEAHRLFGNKLFGAASEDGVSYAILTNWMEGADSTRQKVIAAILKKLLWRFY
ncbi:MAG: hypothetical protein EON60_12410 [Alphaproteobacteria bacterium]|nr:MAG: hypothetical protein EON60_12410 [Alphaproteobacteria bacterium]